MNSLKMGCQIHEYITTQRANQRADLPFRFLGSELVSDGVGLAFLGSIEPGTVSSAGNFFLVLEEARFMDFVVHVDGSELVSSLSVCVIFLLLDFLCLQTFFLLVFFFSQSYLFLHSISLRDL